MPTLALHRRQTWRPLILAALLATLVMFNSHLFYHHHPMPIIVRAAYHHIVPNHTIDVVPAQNATANGTTSANETIAIALSSNIS